jgi:hypothetical protein
METILREARAVKSPASAFVGRGARVDLSKPGHATFSQRLLLYKID